MPRGETLPEPDAEPEREREDVIVGDTELVNDIVGDTEPVCEDDSDFELVDVIVSDTELVGVIVGDRVTDGVGVKAMARTTVLFTSVA